MIRAYAHTERFGDIVALSLVRSPDAGDFESKPKVLRIGPATDGFQRSTWEEFEPHANVEPTLRLSMHETLALAEALAELQHGTSELRALREDYKAERGRVDTLIGTLSAVVTAAAR
jgi:hypothetical protein